MKKNLLFVLWSFFKVTDWVRGLTQNVSLCKITVPSKEMLLSFSLVTFLTNYDVT